MPRYVSISLSLFYPRALGKPALLFLGGGGLIHLTTYLLSRPLQVQRTMRAIKHVLTERYYVWEDAVDLARQDPEIDLSGEGPAFAPQEYFEEELPEEAEEGVAGASIEGASETQGKTHGTSAATPSSDSASAKPTS